MAATDTQEIEESAKGITAWFQGTFLNGDAGDAAWLVGKTLLLFMACLVAKRLILASMSRILAKTPMERGLQTFLRSMTNILLWMASIIIVAGSLKINITAPLAVFGMAGLALSLAVQDSLSNLAGGINILASRPFVVGDYIEIDADGGTVKEIGMIHTTLTTVDHRRIMLPNSKVMSARVINYSTEERRRIDLGFSVSYDAPLERVQGAILEMLQKEPRILQDEAPQVIVKDYGESSIEYGLRAWCTREDYWVLYYDVLGAIKPALDACGIDMTYPHLNVHIRTPNPKNGM